jgi:hypothetical protein
MRLAVVLRLETRASSLARGFDPRHPPGRIVARCGVFDRLGRACSAAFLAALAAPLSCGARSELFASAPIDGGAEAAGKVHVECMGQHVAGKLAPAYLELVLDGSGSMADDGKWDAAIGALNALFDEYLSSEDGETALGLLVFSDHKDITGADGPYPTAVDVAPGYVDRKQYDALRARITGTRPIGPTPTFLALSGAYATLRAFAPTPPLKPLGRRVAVLLSDGSPNATSATGGVDAEKNKTIALAKDQLATSPSIRTYAIGIGPFPPPAWFDYDPEFMGNLAIAGGTRAHEDCDPGSLSLDRICHFQITPSASRTAADLAIDMLRALHNARARTVDLCAYTLDGDFDRFDPSRTVVTVTSKERGAHQIARDAVNGWDYDAPTAPRAVSLRGAACEEVTNDVAATVAMSFGCVR